MADEKTLSAVCKRCGKQFSKDELGADREQLYCSSCMMEIAEEHVPEEAGMPRLKRLRKSRVGVALLWIILCVSVVIIAIQAPKLISAFEEEQPVRRGTYTTDARTDQCIRNLWRISKLLQEGKMPGEKIVCPVSKKPYVVTRTKKDTVACCPNPHMHGFSKVQVSKNNPIPELIK